MPRYKERQRAYTGLGALPAYPAVTVTLTIEIGSVGRDCAPSVPYVLGIATI